MKSEAKLVSYLPYFSRTTGYTYVLTIGIWHNTLKFKLHVATRIVEMNRRDDVALDQR